MFSIQSAILRGTLKSSTSLDVEFRFPESFIAEESYKHTRLVTPGRTLSRVRRI